MWGEVEWEQKDRYDNGEIKKWRYFGGIGKCSSDISMTLHKS